MYNISIIFNDFACFVMHFYYVNTFKIILYSDFHIFFITLKRYIINYHIIM